MVLEPPGPDQTGRPTKPRVRSTGHSTNTIFNQALQLALKANMELQLTGALITAWHFPGKDSRKVPGNPQSLVLVIALPLLGVGPEQSRLMLHGAKGGMRHVSNTVADASLARHHRCRDWFCWKSYWWATSRAPKNQRTCDYVGRATPLCPPPKGQTRPQASNLQKFIMTRPATTTKESSPIDELQAV